MINPDLYKRTTDILFDAYFNDTLEHDDYCGCAVGNIIAANMGIKSVKSDFGVSWLNTPYFGGEWLALVRYNYTFTHEQIKRHGKKQIESTGYSIKELSVIESAFEYANREWCDAIYSKDTWMFNGLCAVLEALKQIHQIDNDEPVVKRFTNHYNTLVK